LFSSDVLGENIQLLKYRESGKRNESSSDPRRRGGLSARGQGEGEEHTLISGNNVSACGKSSQMGDYAQVSSALMRAVL